VGLALSHFLVKVGFIDDAFFNLDKYGHFADTPA